MSCRWKTIRGRRVRVGPTTGIGAPVVVGELSIQLRLGALGLTLATHSPSYTIEELKDAIIRLWRREEGGDMAEVRIKPGAPPIYHSVTPEQAEQIESGEVSAELIADLCHPTEPAMA